jgi:hypothetical protein
MIFNHPIYGFSSTGTGIFTAESMLLKPHNLCHTHKAVVPGSYEVLEKTFMI